MSVTLENTSVAGVSILSTPVFRDHRGEFEVFWERDDLTAMGIVFQPESAHHSYNRQKGTLRGFHYQTAPHGQTKMVSCVAGRIWDVAVDLRIDSLTYLHWSATELVAGSGRSLLIPAGCAHGFVTLEDHSTVAYLIEGAYRQDASAVLRWNDPAVAVPWPVKEPIVSAKDIAAPLL